MKEKRTKEYKTLVVEIGQAFKKLPNDRAQLEVLIGLISIITKKAELTNQSGLLKNWLEIAEAVFVDAHMLWKDS